VALPNSSGASVVVVCWSAREKVNFMLLERRAKGQVSVAGEQGSCILFCLPLVMSVCIENPRCIHLWGAMQR
jgi:hypothetical protein